MKVKRSRAGIEVRLESIEATLLTELARQVRALVADDGGADADVDPLEQLLGIRERRRPDDPATARLLPDAYREDEAASEEFRRLAEGDVRKAKSAALDVLLAAVPAGGGRFVLDLPSAEAWLQALTDVRLMVGIRLEIDSDPDVALRRLPRRDARARPLVIYAWLGELQERLVLAVTGG